MAKLSGPMTLPDDHAALVGRVSDAWAHLENQVDRGIWSLVGAPQQYTACVTSQMLSIHPKLEAFAALIYVQSGNKDWVKEVTSFQGGIAGLATQRNRRVHDARFKHKITGKISRLDTTAKGGKVIFEMVEEPKGELEALHNKIYEKVHEFIALRDQLLTDIALLPEEDLPILAEITGVPQSKPTQTNGK